LFPDLFKQRKFSPLKISPNPNFSARFWSLLKSQFECLSLWGIQNSARPFWHLFQPITVMMVVMMEIGSLKGKIQFGKGRH
jgi:hypothetical protein